MFMQPKSFDIEEDIPTNSKSPIEICSIRIEDSCLSHRDLDLKWKVSVE